MSTIYTNFVNFFVDTFSLPLDVCQRLISCFLFFVFYFMVFRLPVAIFNRTSDRRIATAWSDRFVFAFCLIYNCAPLIRGLLYAGT